METVSPKSTPTDTREQLSVEEFHARLRAQGTSTFNHVAFRCVMCGTIQSMSSFVLAGHTSEEAERYIGFSCIGRSTGAGAWIQGDPKRAEIAGCDWTCGGLFGALGRGVVVLAGGNKHDRFWLATPEEAQELAKRNGFPFRSDKGGEQ